MPRSIDAIDLARLAKARGMRGLVLKNHYESTAALAYMVRKVVPGIEIFGGIDLNRSVGGINPAAVERMVLMKGGWGRVVWMPDLRRREPGARFARRSSVCLRVEERAIAAGGEANRRACGQEQIWYARNRALIRGGGTADRSRSAAASRGAHSSDSRDAGAGPHDVAQMREAAREGAYIEFVYNGLLGANKASFRDYADAIRAVGAASCILASDLGQVGNPLHPDGLAAFFAALAREGIPEADIGRMSKINPARALGLP